MKQILHFFAPFVLLMLLTFCLGCYFRQFYKTNTTYKVAAPMLEQLRAMESSNGNRVLSMVGFALGTTIIIGGLKKRGHQ